MIRAAVTVATGPDTAEELHLTAIEGWDRMFYGCDADGLRCESMRFERVIRAVDLDTGELLDLRELTGVPPPAAPPRLDLVRRTRPPHGRRTRMPYSKLEKQRDSREHLKRYRLEIIWNHYRNKLIAAFGGRCFACIEDHNLQLDHHVPFAAGGRRVPKNIVPLCVRCNQQKQDTPPEMFYSEEELAALAPLLDAQEELLDFRFDYDRWEESRTEYLLSLGIHPRLLHEATTNPYHRMSVYLEPPIGMSISAVIGDDGEVTVDVGTNGRHADS